MALRLCVLDENAFSCIIILLRLFVFFFWKREEEEKWHSCDCVRKCVLDEKESSLYDGTLNSKQFFLDNLFLI